MRFAIMGAGDIGSRYGARLITAGHDVTFIARGARLAELQSKGLIVPAGSFGPEFVIESVQATDAPQCMAPVDSIVFAVKNYHLDDAANLIKPIVGDDTTIIPLQNGVAAPGRIGDIVGSKHVLGFATYSPNAIGELDGPISNRVQRLADAFNEAGLKVEAVDNIWEPLWRKLCAYASFSPFIVARLSPGDAMANPELAELHRNACREVAAVGQAEGFDIDAKKLVEFASFAPKSKQSMTRDLEAGRRLELEDLIGAVVHKAEQRGISVPVIKTCYQLLKPHEHGN
ncbi:MAG: 2-dehydropantoate 2-reductase [Chloroflexi bacterium]|nr:2-dehydropantoate 2-reductase [Chloroflexota bacterium]